MTGGGLAKQGGTMQRLFRLFGKFDVEGPLVIYEFKRMPPLEWWGLSRFFDLLGGFEFVFALPGLSIPFVHWLWRIPTLLASAVVICREVEDQTWNPLRATTLEVRQIVMAKYGAIFRYMEPHLLMIVAIRAIPAIIFGVSWIASTVTVLPQEGFEYWLSTSAAFLAMAVYFLFSPVLDVAFDGALGMMISTFAERRSTALIMTMLARLSGWLLPLALTAPLQYGLLNGMLGVNQINVIALKAVAVVSTFGPAYAFLWGVPAWISVMVVLVFLISRYALARVMVEVAVRRAGEIEV